MSPVRSALPPLATPLRRALGAALALFVAACSGDALSGTPVIGPAAVSVVSGSGQMGSAGATLAMPLVVLVSDANSEPVPGATVDFTVAVGSATLSPASTTTDADGRASTTLTLGPSAGAIEVRASVSGTALGASFAAMVAGAGGTDPCTSSSAVSFSVGQVLPGVTGSSICLGGGSASAEYTIVAFDGAPKTSAHATLTFSGSGLTTPTASFDVAPGGIGSLGLDGMGASAVRLPSRDFDVRLRDLEKRSLTSRISAARAARSAERVVSARPALSPSLSTIPATTTLGQLLTLNANADDACDVPLNRVGRVVAITQRAVVVADTGNPTGGFTDAEYAAYGSAFDATVDPMVRTNFGAPADIDGNGKVLLFFTRAVNALTPRDADSYVGGFFFARDLFPPTASATADACPTSNDGEMFYLMVPDPNGTINGNVFSKDMVTKTTTAILAHEYQHLVNASRRLYVNTMATEFEETWLDEGLSHVAEELLFYAKTGLAPRTNISSTTLRASQARIDAFNDYAVANFERYSDFLRGPALGSPYADDDSLSTRGAAWSFLRYAADQIGREPWYTLTNSTTVGFSTLALAFGDNLTPLFRDWTTSVAADDVPGAVVRYQQPSWGFRSIFGALGGYPLATTALSSAASTSVTVASGGAAYLRVAVPAGGGGVVAWGALPPGVQISIVRTK